MKKNVIIKLSYWAYAAEESTTCFVTSINDASGNSYFWNGSNNATVKTRINRWEKVWVNIGLPEIKSPKDEIHLCLWSPQGKKVFLDDLSLEFIETTGDKFEP